jgi:poly [ADP-ribose] polymerase
MPKLQVRKASDNSNDGYNETVEYKVLHQANVETNHNKFYAIEIQKNPNGEYRLFTHYGRLGISNVFENRETIKGDSSLITDYDTVKSEFESIIKKKLKGKRNKKTGEMEAYVEVDTVAPTVGSENIRGKAEKTKKVSVKAAIDTSSYDKEVGTLLDQLIKENIHSITSHTSIKYTANGFATELGAVTEEHVDRAREPLDALNKLMGKKGEVNPTKAQVKSLNSLYFSLIPKPFSRKITEDDMILDANQLEAEYDILDQLATAVSMGSAMSGNVSQRMNALGTEISILDDIAEVKRIKKYIRGSKAANHRGSNVWDYDVKRIYKMQIPEEHSKYQKALKKYGAKTVQEVFHGSSNCNLLSILKGGLIIPPSSAGHVTGRMHGDGIYGANNSTKSLNYSIGYWGAKQSRYGNAFLFLADFAMGKTYVSQSANYNGAPRGYDSVWAKKGSSLYNDELIVYSLNQCTLKYIVEMTPRGR